MQKQVWADSLEFDFLLLQDIKIVTDVIIALSNLCSYASSVSVSFAVGKACIIPPTGGIEYKKKKKKKKENTHTHSKSPM
jgi:hypothetical protein